MEAGANSDDDVTCRACGKYYDKPTMLTKCLHILCKECWENQREGGGGGHVACLHCGTTAEPRHLRLNFNKQKEVQQYLKTRQLKALHEANQTMSDLNRKAASLLISLEARRNKRGVKTALDQIAVSEKIMIELVREHHEELRHQTEQKLIGFEKRAIDDVKEMHSILSETESKLDVIFSKEVEALENLEIDSKPLESADKLLKECAEMNENYTSYLSALETNRNESVTIHFQRIGIDEMKEFLNKNCTLDVSVNLDDSPAETRQRLTSDADQLFDSIAALQTSHAMESNLEAAGQHRRELEKETPNESPALHFNPTNPLLSILEDILSEK